MAGDNITTGDGKVASDELDFVNGEPQADPKPQAQRVKIGFGLDGKFDDVNDDNPFPVADRHSGNLLFRILQMLMAPLGYDKALGRQRGTVILESGTVTTVGTVTNVGTVGAVTNIAGVGGFPAQMQIIDANRAAWALSHRSRIT
jgi:hypothetical protein